MPTSTMEQEVYNVVNGSTIRPLTDFVFVEPPVTTGYALNVEYWIDDENSQIETTIQTQVLSAISNWITYMQTSKGSIGRSIVPSKLVQQIMNAGACRVLISSPPYVNVGVNGLAVCTGQTITFMGLEEDDS